MQDMALHMAQDQQLPAVEPWRMALWLMVYYPWLAASYWQWPNIVPLLHPNYKQQPKFFPPPTPAWTAILGVLYSKQRLMWQWWTNNKLSCSGEGTYWVHLMACPQKLLNFCEQLFHTANVKVCFNSICAFVSHFSASSNNKPIFLPFTCNKDNRNN